MAIPYEATGRSRQKARTRAAMVEATRQLFVEGVMSPTVEQVADRAQVSRTTAYRYFPNQEALVLALYPSIDAPSLLGDDPPDDVLERLDRVTAKLVEQTLEHEAELRAMLRLALERPEAQGSLPFRRGRAIRWIQDALSPLRARLAAASFRRLVLAIRAAVGVEPLVWLVDIGGASRAEAAALMRSTARSILRCALLDAGLGDPATEEG